MSAVSAAFHDTIRENNAISHTLVSVVENLEVGNGKNAKLIVGECFAM